MCNSLSSAACGGEDVHQGLAAGDEEHALREEKQREKKHLFKKDPTHVQRPLNVITHGLWTSLTAAPQAVNRPKIQYRRAEKERERESMESEVQAEEAL